MPLPVPIVLVFVCVYMYMAYDINLFPLSLEHFIFIIIEPYFREDQAIEFLSTDCYILFSISDKD